MPLEFSLMSAPLDRDVHVVTVSGDLNFSTAHQLRDELARASDSGAGEIVVDLLEVPFVDSVALGVLVEASKSTRARGGALKVVCEDRRIAWMIEITGLERIRRIQTTLRAAPESPSNDTAMAARNY
jgi:anti-sigma B factor antagonist